MSHDHTHHVRFAAQQGHTLTRRGFVRLGLAGLLALGSAPLALAAESDGRMLVLYFSLTGNTRTVAEYIHKRVGGDLLEIRPATAYPQDYDTLVDLARGEKKRNARPELAGDLPDLRGYNTIFLGFPCWWGTMPMCLFTLLERHDLSGKNIIPFCTHGGSGLADAPRDIKRLCPTATVQQGLAVRGSQVGKAQDAVDAWLDKLGLYARRGR